MPHTHHQSPTTQLLPNTLIIPNAQYLMANAKPNILIIPNTHHLSPNPNILIIPNNHHLSPNPNNSIIAQYLTIPNAQSPKPKSQSPKPKPKPKPNTSQMPKALHITNAQSPTTQLLHNTLIIPNAQIPIHFPLSLEEEANVIQSQIQY